MDLNAIDNPDNSKIFLLVSIMNAGDLEAAREVDLKKVTEELFVGGSDSGRKEDDSDNGDGLGMRSDNDSCKDDVGLPPEE